MQRIQHKQCGPHQETTWGLICPQWAATARGRGGEIKMLTPRQGLARPGQAWPGQARPDQARPGQAKPGLATPFSDNSFIAYFIYLVFDPCEHCKLAQVRWGNMKWHDTVKGLDTRQHKQSNQKV